MKTVEKLIKIIESNSMHRIGEIQTNKDGVRYRYDFYHLKTPFHWVVKMNC